MIGVKKEINHNSIFIMAEQSLQVKAAEQGPMQKFKSQLFGANAQQYFADLLGERKDAFIASVVSVVGSDANLQKCNPMSVALAAYKAVPLNLPIEQNMGYAAVIPYGTNASFQIMRNGWVELAMRTGQVKHIANEPVYDGELVKRNRFTDTYEFDETQRKPGAKIIGFMAYIQLVNGFEKTIYWTDAEVKAHALKYSQAYKKGYGPWKDSYEAMALKTVLKHLIVKYCPKSTELQNAIRDDQTVTNENNVSTYADNEPEFQPQPEAQSESAKAKAAEIKEQVERMKARRAGTELPADAHASPVEEDMPADEQPGEIFNEQ